MKNTSFLSIMNTILLTGTKCAPIAAHAFVQTAVFVPAYVDRQQQRSHSFINKSRTFASTTQLHMAGSKSSSDKDTTKSYHLTGIGIGQKGSTKTQTNTNHIIHTDIPISMGGENTAPQPVEHLLAAFIGCTQATAIFVGRNMQPRILIDRIEFDIKGERDERGALDCLPIIPRAPDGNNDNDHDFDGADEFPSIPARLQCVKGSITVYAKNRKGQEVEIGDNAMRLLETHTERRCPVANMIVDSGCSMQVKWTDGGKLSTLK